MSDIILYVKLLPERSTGLEKTVYDSPRTKVLGYPISEEAEKQLVRHQSIQDQNGKVSGFKQFSYDGETFDLTFISARDFHNFRIDGNILFESSYMRVYSISEEALVMLLFQYG